MLHSEAIQAPTEDDLADFAAFGRRMLTGLAVSYALWLGPQLRVDPSNAAIACPCCGTWAFRLLVVAVLGLACVRCLAASGEGNR